MNKSFRIISWILSVSLAILSFLGVFSPNPEPTPTEPQPVQEDVEKMEITDDYVIVIGNNASASDKNAADILQKYLNQISSKTIKIVPDTTPEQLKEIIVGKTNRENSGWLNINRNKLGNEGVFIKTYDKKIVISGGEKRGVLYAVFTFLEDYFNCRWFTSTLSVIPTANKLEIPKEINYTYVPPLEYRETDWISPHDVTYSLANKLNGNSYRSMSPENGGTMGYTGGLCHTMSSLVPSSYFNTDPEMFALGVKTNKRTTDQPCLTNPKTLEVAIASVRSILKNNPDAEIISVTQNDNTNYCVCENCKKIDKQEGSHAGTMIRFANAIAANIKNDYPNLKIDTFAYQYTRKAPSITKPLDNVIVRLCSIECCFAHPISDKTCPDNKEFCEDILAWKNICKTLYIWDYTTNYANYNGPFPDFQVIQPNIQFFIDCNAIGIYEEGNYSAGECNGEFAELRAYLLANLMWNPNINLEKYMTEFCNAYYGNAAPYILEYLHMTMNKTGTKNVFGRYHMGIYADMTDKSVLNLNSCDIKNINKLWEDAKKANLTPEQLKNVRLSEISWRYWKACNKVSEFSRINLNSSWVTAGKQLYADMVELGIRRINEGSGGELTNLPDYEAIPRKWNK